MKKLILQLLCTFIAWLLILSLALPWNHLWINFPISGQEYKLWLDLSWWIELDYKVDLTEAKQEEWYDASRKKSIIEGLKSIIDKRIESLNINDSIITDASYGWEEHIIVQIPLKGNTSLENSENIQKAKAAIGKVVTIAFKELKDLSALSDEQREALGDDIWIEAEDSQGRVLDDRYFVNSSLQYNEAFNPMVELTFNTQWAEIFGELTKRLVGQPLAIFVWWELLTAPNINEPILSGRAVITWNYTPESAKALSDDINIWVVPAPILLTSERTIDARLGNDSLQKIIFAGATGFVLILMFLIWVYRLSGLIAAIALFIYVVIILAILKQFWVVLTLASIAWLVLSLGIAIDANILIFERIKDELKKGQNIISAQRKGFEKSFSAIWDANITGFYRCSDTLYFFESIWLKGLVLSLQYELLWAYFQYFLFQDFFIQILAACQVSEKKLYLSQEVVYQKYDISEYSQGVALKKLF